MNLPTPATIVSFCLAIVYLAGCSTASDQIGSDGFGLKVGKQYVLKRDAILLSHRGLADSIENPDYSLADYKAYRDYSPYDTLPIGVLPSGTVIQVKEIRLFRHDNFRVMGEIMTGKYKRQPVDAYDVLKGYTIGGWPPTGEVFMNSLCGGCSFDPSQLARNLSEKVE
jgi:hypothetical protein